MIYITSKQYTNMNEVQNNNLELCIKVCKYLKELNPNDIMKIENNTIVAFVCKSRLCSDKSMSGYAHYHNKKPHRICIKQKVLLDTNMLKTGFSRNDKNRVMLNGNFSLIELMCHELGHHRTKGHGKKFHIKYNKFLTQMSLSIISGEFYE